MIFCPGDMISLNNLFFFIFIKECKENYPQNILCKSQIQKQIIFEKDKHISVKKIAYLGPFYVLSRGHEMPRFTIFRRMYQINLKNVSFSNHIFRYKGCFKKINIFLVLNLYIFTLFMLCPRDMKSPNWLYSVE